MSRLRKSILIIGILIVVIAASLGTALALFATGSIKTDPIELTFSIKDDFQMEYTGETLNYSYIMAHPEKFGLAEGEEPYEMTSGKLNRGDRVSVEFLGEQTDVASWEKTARIDLSVKVYDENNYNVTENYTIKVNPKSNLEEYYKLKIDPRTVDINIVQQEVVYSGNNIGFDASDYNTPNNKLVDGHKFYCFAEKCNADEKLTKKDLTPRIYDLAGNDVTANYDLSNFKIVNADGVEVEEGLKIVKRPLYMRAPSYSGAFDAQEHDLSKAEFFNGTSLVDGQYARYTINGKYDLKQKNATDSANPIITQIDQDSVEIFAEGKNVNLKDNYEIFFEPGLVEISRRRVDVYAPSKTAEYDGEELTFTKDNTIDESRVVGLIEGEKILNVVYAGSQRDVGSSTNRVSSIMLSFNQDNYEFYSTESQHLGTLTVTPRMRTLTTPTKERYYVTDATGAGVPLTVELDDISDFTDVANGNIVSRHRVELVGVPSITDAGSIEDRFSIKIFEDDVATGTSRDVSNNYVINYAYGRLTVKKVPVTVELLAVEATFNGNERTLTIDTPNSNEVQAALQLKSNIPTTDPEHDTYELKLTAKDDLEIVDYTAETGGTIKFVGDYNYSVRFADESLSTNYELSTTKTGVLKIKPLGVELNVLDQSVVFDNQVHTVSVSNAIELPASCSGLLDHTDFVAECAFELRYYRAVGYPYTVKMADAEYAKNFAFTYKNGKTEGTFTIEKSDVTLTLAQDLEHIYNGRPASFTVDEVITDLENAQGCITKSDFKVTNENSDKVKVDGHTYSIKVAFADAEYAKNFNDIIYDGEDRGHYTIVRCKISVTLKNYTGTDAFTYTGKAITVQPEDAVTFEILSSFEGEPDFISVSDFQIFYSVASIVNQGNYTYNVSLGSKGGNFSVTYNPDPLVDNASIVVNRRDVTVTVMDELKEYDGTGLSTELFSAIHSIDDEVTGLTPADFKIVEHTHRGPAEDAHYNTLVSGIDSSLIGKTEYFTVEIKDTTKAGNYNVTIVNRENTAHNFGVKVLIKYVITVTTATHEFVYDGDSHSDGNFEYTTPINSGHKLKFDSTGPALPTVQNAGDSKLNEFKVVVVSKLNVNDEAPNAYYFLQYVHGTLTVVSCPVKVQIFNAVRTFNIVEQTVNIGELVKVTGGLTVGNFKLSAGSGNVTSIGVTNAGTTTFTVIYDKTTNSNRSEANYAFTYVDADGNDIPTAEGKIVVKKFAVNVNLVYYKALFQSYIAPATNPNVLNATDVIKFGSIGTEMSAYIMARLDITCPSSYFSYSRLTKKIEITRPGDYTYTVTCNDGSNIDVSFVGDINYNRIELTTIQVKVTLKDKVKEFDNDSVVLRFGDLVTFSYDFSDTQKNLFSLDFSSGDPITPNGSTSSREFGPSACNLTYELKFDSTKLLGFEFVYNEDKESGKVEITPFEVTVTLASVNNEFTNANQTFAKSDLVHFSRGDALSVSMLAQLEMRVTKSENVVGGDGMSINAPDNTELTARDVGNYEYAITVKAGNVNFNFTFHNYINKGSIIITPNKVTLTVANSGETVFDNSGHTVNIDDVLTVSSSILTVDDFKFEYNNDVEFSYTDVADSFSSSIVYAGSDSYNYDFSYKYGVDYYSLTVKPAVLRVALNSKTYVYTGSALGITKGTLLSVIEKPDWFQESHIDVVNSVPGGSKYASIKNAGEYNYEFSFTIRVDLNNYQIYFRNDETRATVTVLPADVVVTVGSYLNKYSGGAQTVNIDDILEVDGLINSSKFVFTESKAATISVENAGTYNKAVEDNLSATERGNYNIIYRNGVNKATIVITPLNVTAVMKDVTRTYVNATFGLSNSALFSVSIPDYTTAESYFDVSGTPALSAVTEVGTYEYKLTYDARINPVNYVINYKNGKDVAIFTVAPAPVTVTMRSIEKTYTGSAFTITKSDLIDVECAVSGVVDAFDLVGMSASTPTYNSLITVGEYVYKATATGLSMTNFTVTYKYGRDLATVTVKPADAIITLTGATFTFKNAAVCTGADAAIGRFVEIDSEVLTTDYFNIEGAPASTPAITSLKDAGTYTYKLKYVNATVEVKNFNILYRYERKTFDIVVDPAEVVVVLGSYSTTYKSAGENVALSSVLEVPAGQTLGISNFTYDNGTTSFPVTDAKTYSAGIKIVNDPAIKVTNYKLVYTSNLQRATIVVNPANVNVYVTPYTLEYTESGSTVSLSNVLNVPTGQALSFSNFKFENGTTSYSVTDANTYFATVKLTVTDPYNYNVIYSNGVNASQITVTPKAVTVYLKTHTRTYDATSHTVQFSDVCDRVVGLSSSSFALDGTTTTLNAATYTFPVKLTVGTPTNYSVTYAGGSSVATAVVNPMDVFVTVTGVDRVYSGSAHTVNTNNVISFVGEHGTLSEGDFKFHIDGGDCTSFYKTDAGHYAFSVKFSASGADNYSVQFTSGVNSAELYIAKKDVSVTFKTHTLEYNRATQTVSMSDVIAAISEGMAVSDFSFTSTPSVENAKTYTFGVECTHSQKANYNVVYSTGAPVATVVVTPKRQFVTMKTFEMVFDNTNHTVVPGDVVEDAGALTVSDFAISGTTTIKDVGSYTMTITYNGSDKDNYDLVYSGGSAVFATVKKAPVSVKVKSDVLTYGADYTGSKTYDRSDLIEVTDVGALGVDVASFVFSDSSTSLTVTDVGTYNFAVVYSGSIDIKNIEITYVTGMQSGSIEVRPTTVIVSLASEVIDYFDSYDVSSRTRLFELSSLISVTTGTDVVDADFVLADGSTGFTVGNVGTYPYTVKFESASRKETNYIIIYNGSQTGSIKVNPKPVSFTLNGFEKFYSGEVYAIELVDDTFSIGLDSVGLTVGDFRPVCNSELKNVGSYPFTVELVGANANNYAVTVLTSNKFTIKKLAVTVSLKALGARTYDGTAVAIDPTAAIVTITGTPSGSLGIADLLSKDDFTVRATGGGEIRLAGSYVLEAFITDSVYARNFDLTCNTGSITINKCKVMLGLSDFNSADEYGPYNVTSSVVFLSAVPADGAFRITLAYASLIDDQGNCLLATVTVTFDDPAFEGCYEFYGAASINGVSGGTPSSAVRVLVAPVTP